MKPEGVEKEFIKLRVFPYGLHGVTKDWLYDLSPNSITTWDAMLCAFLCKYFPTSKAPSIRKVTCGIMQLSGETSHEY